MATYYEKEIVEYLGLPSIPKKEWNGIDAFSKGVAVIELRDCAGDDAYAVATFDPEAGQTAPHITKVFGIEPFLNIKKIYIVPNYMTNIEDVPSLDLDDESKKKAVEILREAAEIENEGVEDNSSLATLPEWVFDEIHNRDEAEAWLRNYNQMNHLRGRVPKSEETLKLRLYAIYAEKKSKGL